LATVTIILRIQPNLSASNAEIHCYPKLVCF